MPSNILRGENKLSNQREYTNLQKLPELSQILAARLSLPYSNVSIDSLHIFCVWKVKVKARGHEQAVSQV